MTAQDGLQLFVKLAEAAQRTICPKTMLASSRKGIPFVIAAVFLMSLQDALFKLVSGDIVLWQG